VVVRAKTGTGKTGAFAIPTIQKVLEAKRQGIQGVKAVVISPTRELAQQISDEITAITAYGELRNIKTMCFVGGLSKSNQIRNGLTGRNVVDIVVATPGRLLDLISEQQVVDSFANVTIKVLDEADRLLDIGFKDALTDIDNIMKSVHNATFQTLLFSATTDRSMMDFAEGELGGNAAIIDTVPANEPQAQELVHQESMVCTNWRDIYYAGAQAMEHETHTSDQMKQHFKAIVFMPTVLLVQHYGAVLKEYFAKTRGRGFVQSIHGRLTQAKRQRISDEFRKSKEGILVTTDVVARGMDFPNVSHVFQLGCPPEIASYVHRIGRTARIGHEGKSLLIHTAQESRFLEELQKKKITMQRYLTFEPKVRLVKRIEEICPTKLEDDGDADSVYTSLFAAYEPVKKNFKMDGPGFLRDQDHFAALLGIENPRLPIRLRDSWQRDISMPPRSRSYGGRGGGRPQGQNNRGRRMRW
jgi:ATP-dependent RNA helicase MSS116